MTEVTQGNEAGDDRSIALIDSAPNFIDQPTYSSCQTERITKVKTVSIAEPLKNWQHVHTLYLAKFGM